MLKLNCWICYNGVLDSSHLVSINDNPALYQLWLGKCERKRE